MAGVRLVPTLVLEVTAQEFRLLGLGLARRLQGKEAAEAADLNLRLQRARSRHLEELRQVAAGAEQKAEEAVAEWAAAGEEVGDGEGVPRR
jgi:hypothetical protein